MVEEMPKKNKPHIYLFQFNFKYGNEVFLPYSAGMLWAYAKTHKEIEDNYENKDFIFLREDPDKIVASLDNPGVAAFSTYVWNWEMSVEVAKRIKEKFPSCTIVFGGPQVPDRMEGFFDKYPFIDITIHGEGELTFSEFLKEHLNDKGYSQIKGLTFNSKDGKSNPFEKRERIENLNMLPSPYLTGLFDEIAKLPYNFQPMWETNRGCPYSCTYCDWGSATTTRIRLFDTERLTKEIDWFADKKMAFIFGCDANFGIFPRDVEIAKLLAKKKIETGYPGKFRVSYAKNTTERVIQIAEILNAVKLDKGITLSMQSMDQNVLKIIKRTNLNIKSISEFVKQFQKKSIATYTELILGLPGETYETFKEGVNDLLVAGVHDSLTIYNCSVLPNAPLNDPDYRKTYEIKTLRIPIFLNHSVPGDDPVQEFEEMIISTKTLSTEDWKKQYIFSWIVQTFHSLNLTQTLAIYFYYVNNTSYSDFYEGLLSFAKENPNSIIGNELTFTESKVDNVLEGNGWDIVMEEFSNITWSTEEASYLRISKNLDKFYVEIEKFIVGLCRKFDLALDTELIKDLIKYQKSIIVKWTKNGSQEFELNYSLHNFYKCRLIGERTELRKGRFRLKIQDNLNLNGDKERYAREIVWWGRKGGKFIYQNIEETIIEPEIKVEF